MIVLLIGLVGQVTGQQVEATSTTTIPVAFTINGVRTNDISATLSPDGKLLDVDGAALLSLLRRPAAPVLLHGLSKMVSASKSVTPSSLRRLGLSVAFDTQKLELRIAIPPNLQRVTSLRVVRSSAPSTAVRVRPAALSAQLSASGQVDLYDQYVTANGGSPPAASLDVPLSLTLRPAINYRTWVVESDMSINTLSNQYFSLADLRLVKDFPGPDLRLTAGTLNYARTGFSSDIPIMGIGIGTNFDLSPTRLYRPLGHFGFYLEHPSQVRVLVNGQVIRYLELQPGPYMLSDFPFNPGMNSVALEIQDNTGNVERLARSFPFAQDLLLPGRSSFSANIGLPGWQIAPPVFSGFERIGVTNDLTLGAYTQAGIDSQLAGLEGTVASPVGTLHLDVAGSHASTHPPDVGVYASYRLLDVSRRFLPSLTLSAQYRGRYLLGPESYFSESPFEWAVQGTVSQELPKNIGLSVGAGYSLPWSGGATYNGTAIVTAPLGRGVSLSFTAGASYVPGGRVGWSGGISIISAGRATTVTSVNQSLTEPTGQFSVSYQPQRIPGLALTGTLTGPPGMPGQPTAASVNLNYSGNRFRAALGQSISDDGLSNPTTISSHSFLRLGSALVYADGVLAVTRPVTDGFAIFVPRASLRRYRIDVSPDQGTTGVHSGSLGGAVLPDVSSYTSTLARIDVPKAPMGYDLGNTLFLLSLPYRGGAIVRVGTNATVYAEGTIVDAAGKPVSLVAGSMTPEKKGGRARIFFTDESGRFQVYHLAPGTYRLVLAAQHWAAVTVTIPEKASGQYELGKIIVTHQEVKP